MCGIVGYTGPKDAYPVIIKGLKRLEYRSYDSTGVALQNGSLKVYKKKEKLQNWKSPLSAKILKVIPVSGTPAGQRMANPAMRMRILTNRPVVS